MLKQTEVTMTINSHFPSDKLWPEHKPEGTAQNVEVPYILLGWIVEAMFE